MAFEIPFTKTAAGHGRAPQSPCSRNSDPRANHDGDVRLGGPFRQP